MPRLWYGYHAMSTTANGAAPVRCAIIGLGRIGSLLEEDTLREKPCTHAGAIVADPGALLVGGCDHNHERREQFKRRWGCPIVTADADELLARCHPQLVVVATPPKSHRQLVECTAQHGAEVVICEKPIATTLRDARAIVRLQQRLRIVVNHERRYSRDYLQVRTMLQQERFGRLLSFRAALYFGRRARHDHILLHDGIHMVDSIAFLIGSRLHPVRLHGDAMRSNRGSIFIGVQAADVIGTIEVGAERDHLVFELELSLEKGRIRIGNGVYTIEESCPSPYYESYRSLLPTDDRPPLPSGYFSGMLTDALRCVHDPQRSPISNARTATAALECIQHIRRMRR